MAPDIPEDLYYMIKKAVVMRKHLEVNRKDKDGKFRLILVESRIHRLARYYKVSAAACFPNTIFDLTCPAMLLSIKCVCCCMCYMLTSCITGVQRVKKLAPNWKYESSTASALVA